MLQAVVQVEFAGLKALADLTVQPERRWIGGSCPNIACMPSKNVIWSAKVASLSGRGPEFGLPSASTVDMAAVRRRKRKLVEDMVNVHLDPAR